MAFAIERLKYGDMSQAEAIFGKILGVAPEYPAALHYLGMIRHRSGDEAGALDLVRRSLELVPDQADWHSNHGIVLQGTDDLDGAMAAFERAIALNPHHAPAHNNLGVLLRVFSQNERAEAAYRRAIEVDPTHADAYSNLAILLSVVGRTREAVTAYCRALALKPALPGARRLLVIAYCALGDFDKALATCEQWVADDPDDPVARHMLSSVSGRDVPPRAPDDYVQVTFDGFSQTFEAKLARLDYKAPTLVAESVAQSGVQPSGALDVLDLGCGTGLCGPLLAPYARRLVGVDLSEGMLEHARAKQIYDLLAQVELTEYLNRCDERFDIAVSADTLVYFGPLEAVARGACAVLRDKGVFVFTVEESVDEASSAPYTIQHHGRFCHRADYVERVLRDAGLTPTIGRGTLRMESGLPVPGLIVRATKDAGRTAGEHDA